MSRAELTILFNQPLNVDLHAETNIYLQFKKAKFIKNAHNEEEIQIKC